MIHVLHHSEGTYLTRRGNNNCNNIDICVMPTVNSNPKLQSYDSSPEFRSDYILLLGDTRHSSFYEHATQQLFNL